MIKLKNILAENMRRFRTKNLNEDRFERSDNNDPEEDPISVSFDINIETNLLGYPVTIKSVTLHYWGEYVQYNASYEEKNPSDDLDHYSDSEASWIVDETYDIIKTRPAFKQWLTAINKFGHDPKTIITALHDIDFTESGMNESGDWNTESYLD